MEKFIEDFFTRIGIGLNGYIANLSSDKVRELFPNYQFVIENVKDTNSVLKVVSNVTNEPILTAHYVHKENGRITQISVQKS